MNQVTLGMLVWMTAAAFLTICIFSFLYRDNPLYRFAEHLTVGVSAGYWIAILYHTSLKDLWIEPLGSSINTLGQPSGSLAARIGMLIVNITPGLLGLLMFSRFWKKISWISRWPIAFILGISAGVALPLFLQSFVVRQVAANMMNPRDIFNSITADITIMLATGNGTLLFWEGFGRIVIVIGCICGLAYFYFSAEHKGLLGGAAKVGIWTLMIGFGATFGYTVMSRISLLIGRFNYLIGWVTSIGNYLKQ
jgi:hypothetical protein